MKENEGFIYVLTNPSFPEYVKIGYADNVYTRVEQLNRSECTPFAFRIYASLHVSNRLADKNIHRIIDKFKPELRAKENVNGKMRVREFFAMSPEEAVDLLETIGSIYGETPRLYSQTAEEKKEEQFAINTAVASERRSPFSFYSCGINNGEQVVYVKDPQIVCTVVGDREISFNGKNTSLSALAKKLLNKKQGVQGTLFFSYKGETLSALRKRLEDENQYNYNKSLESNNTILISDTKQTKSIENTNDYVDLFFAMDKYKAKCLWSNNEFILLKNSAISPALAPSCRNSIRELRKKYAESISPAFILETDITFSSSSSAAMFVSGSSLNGKTSWKNENGILLRDLM